jgi:hypothetical protein
MIKLKNCRVGVKQQSLIHSLAHSLVIMPVIRVGRYLYCVACLQRFYKIYVRDGDVYNLPFQYFYFKRT